MERTVYEAPVTERFQVELEGSFCGSAEVESGDAQKQVVGITNQGISETFDSNSFSNNTWEDVE